VKISAGTDTQVKAGQECRKKLGISDFGAPYLYSNVYRNPFQVSRFSFGICDLCLLLLCIFVPDYAAFFLFLELGSTSKF
jgi:hypothetical protein